jgi:hypothetical protein
MTSDPSEKNISRSADILLQKIEKEDVFHGLVGLIPGGALLDALLFRRIKKKARERIEEFSDKFENQIKEISEDKLDKGFLQSDEFEGLILKVIEKTATEHSEDKRNYFRSILLNSVTYDYSKSPIKEIVIELIDELSPVHVKMLELFISNKLPSSDYGGQGYSAAGAPKFIKGLSCEDAEAVGTDLCRKSLLNSLDENYQFMIVTPLGRELLKFIKAPLSSV